MATDRRPEFFKGAQLKVAIIGCGYVGLPLALRFAEAGHKVTGFDTDPEKVKLLLSYSICETQKKRVKITCALPSTGKRRPLLISVPHVGYLSGT